MYAALSINLQDNLHMFWECRHLFKANGYSFNKSGVQLLSSNIFYVVHPKDNPK